MTTTTTTTQPVDNGVDIEAILGAREAMTGMPAAAAFQWRARTTWVDGTHSRTTVSDFFGVGEEQSHRQDHVLEGDHPEIFASQDNGPAPVETALAALGACLTAGVATVATNRGIQLRQVTAHVEADMDLQGIMGIDPAVRNGFSSVRVRFDIDADATREELAEVVAQSQRRSAVHDVLSNPTSVQVVLS